ncbi:MAG: HNH endonuclease [Planctomycetes bacterium]|nr:HNH endonuclease [Planctomycetota bacterium]
MNRWKIPDLLEREVIERDRRCVYCGVDFVSSNETRKSKPTWEHIVNDERITNRENIARCCFSCNASKGAKDLSVWLESNYCKKRGITKDTVAEVVRKALAYPPQVGDLGA